MNKKQDKSIAFPAHILENAQSKEELAEWLMTALSQRQDGLGEELLEPLKALEEELTYELFPTLDREKGALNVKTEGDDSTQTKTYSSFYPISLAAIEAKIAQKSSRRNKSSHENETQPSLFGYQPVNNVKEIVNEFGEKIIRVEGDIPVDLTVNNGDRFLFISYDQSLLTHGLHKYPAKCTANTHVRIPYAARRTSAFR